MATSRMHFTGQLSDLDLRHLRVFKTVVESGGFAAAEAELNVTGSAISQSMSDLERRLGFKLCNRGRSGFSLTEAGKQTYETTLELLSSLDAFKNQINAIHSLLKGEFRIGITDNLITMRRMRIVHSLQALKRQAPDVTINIRMLPPNEIEKGVLNGVFHVGMVPKFRTCVGLDYHPMYDEQWGLYCGEEHSLFSIADQDMSPEMVLCEDAISTAYAQPDDIKEQFSRFKSTAVASDREGTAFLIMTGCYIGFLPTHYAEQWISQNTMRRILPNEFCFTVEYVAITKPQIDGNLILGNYLEALKSTSV
ncbi:LysR family transcriptional regulator [Vogesella sp. LIG4]|uniref:LysR family transcriptional regulator n=1 Tax=Vogesella sp. LIG4 TaxID=1192162 RepID=UPI00081F91B4|nr:LysR family transcriptional regulator [Vogesella sp. LIG4]SCK28074.1 DNA-binding transcriptional regulator, LysR family [Vogesella sp. LIG4]